MVSCRSMKKVENAAKDAMISDKVVVCIADEVARSIQLIKPIDVFVAIRCTTLCSSGWRRSVSATVENLSQPKRLNMSRVDTVLNERKVT